MCESEVMSYSDWLSRPDAHLDPEVAARYDAAAAPHFEESALRPVIERLGEFAEGGKAVEFAVGTGRVALPLAAAGVPVHGIDFSEAMLDQLRSKPGAQDLGITVGDMSETHICDDASVVYLVFNTIMNLRTQAAQVACFENAAAHLRPGGRFVIECVVPHLRQLPADSEVRPFHLSPTRVGFEEYVDLVNQISVSYHFFVDGPDSRVTYGSFRYVWPSELDLMARIAGMELESRWEDWDRAPFTAKSTSHVSVWRKA